MVYELKKIDLWSALKVCFLISLIGGIIISIIFSIFFMIIFAIPGQFDRYDSFSGSGLNPAAFGVFGGIIIGVLYGFAFVVINGIITPLITVLLYNLVAAWVGGIKIKLNKIEEVAYPAQPSTGQMQQPGNTTGGIT